MPKNYHYKQRKRGKEQFVAIYHHMADTVAWRTLKPAARALYLEVKRQYKKQMLRTDVNKLKFNKGF